MRSLPDSIRRSWKLIGVFFLGHAIPLSFSHAKSAGPDFNSEIRPILSDRCFKCHGTDEAAREGDLRLDNREGALVVLDLENLEDSELYYRLTTDFAEDRMPPRNKAKPLSVPERDLLIEWVRAGAPYEEHWAYIESIPETGIFKRVGKRAAFAGPKFSQLRSIRALLRLSNSPGFKLLSLMPDFGHAAALPLLAPSVLISAWDGAEGSSRLSLSFDPLFSDFSTDPGEVVGEHAPPHCEPAVF